MNSRGKESKGGQERVHVHVGQFVRLVVRTVVAVHTARGQRFRRSYIWSPAEDKCGGSGSKSGRNGSHPFRACSLSRHAVKSQPCRSVGRSSGASSHMASRWHFRLAVMHAVRRRVIGASRPDSLPIRWSHPWGPGRRPARLSEGRFRPSRSTGWLQFWYILT